MLSVKINNVDKSANVLVNSISISDAVNERSTASLSILDKTGTYRPVIGETVEIYDDTDLVFAGTIDDLPEEVIEGTSILRYNNVPLVDFHQIADRKIVAEAYESKTAGYIVTDILTKYLADEDITEGTIRTGPTITKAVFNYLTASQCLNELSEITGFQWQINYDKSLDFFDRTTFTGTAITDTSAIKDLRVKKTRQQYRNRQYLRAGQDISTSQTRTYKGDGETQVFNVDLPIAKEPTITVDSVAKTVGIRGLETGYDWYWQKNDKSISQDDNGTKLTTSNTLSVVYQGYYPIIVVAEDPEEVEARKTIEGGTGYYESIEEKLSIDTKDSALEYTNGLLRRFANIEMEVEFSTFTKYEAGQLVSVNLPKHSINENMLVSSVDLSDIGAYDERLQYRVRLVSGESFGGWVNFFKKIAEKNTTFAIRENEILVKLATMKDSFINLSLSVTDEMTYTIHQYLICDTDQYCGTDVII